MKKKFFVSALAGVLALSALAGCADNGGKQVTFGHYWQKDSLSGGQVEETLRYAVTFEANAGMDAMKYTLEYKEGSYTTHLKTTTQGYEYTTELSLPVVYTYGEKKAEFTDYVKSTVVFENKAALTPISSTKEVYSHTPSNATPSTVEDCYGEYHYTVTTAYGKDNKATSKVEYIKTEDFDAETLSREFTYGKGDYSYIDNEMLLLALRAVDKDTDSGKIKSYYPTEDKTEKLNFSFTEATDREFNHTVNGAPLSNKNISYREVTLSLSATNPGASQTAWIATAADVKNNTHRNVMLSLNTKLSYNLGTLTYTLKSVEQL